MKRKLIISLVAVLLIMMLTACDMSLGGMMGRNRNSTNNGTNHNSSNNDANSNNESAPMVESFISDTMDSLTEDTAIDKQRAKDIALNHAGIKAENISGYRVELDRDNGVTSYEIEFDSDGYEYSYDINAKTGEIIKSEKDRIN
ncbi:MAG: PepSY domain-containing protein [Clostridia bacterium]|nr:PepSY domain-containing protein [Clostridia bacterium]